MENKQLSYLHEGFEIQVKEHGMNIAVCMDGFKLTYLELDQLSDRIKTIIDDNTSKSNEIIGIYGEKNIYAIAAMIAVLKAGAAYLPLDINYPDVRIEYMLKQCSTNIVLGINTDDISERFDTIKFIDLLKELDRGASIQDTDINSGKITIDNNSLAYVIFTSGSTGKPNGVMIRHKNIINTINWRINYYHLTSKSVALQFSSISFDSSVEDIFSILSTGGTLILPSDKQKLNMAYLGNLMSEYTINHLLVVPSMYDIILKTIPDKMKTLSQVVLAGEKVNQDLVRMHYNLLPNTMLYNEYGPTENSVCSTVSVLHPNKEVTIGKFIPNVFGYIVDENQKAVNNCDFGDLILGGSGIALGYINNQSASNAKFFVDENGQYVYDSGDIVRINSDGDFIYLGRKDREIKINGKRINLDEIENVAFEVLGISELAVISQNINAISTIYLFLKGYMNTNKEEVINLMSDKLPKYMLPHEIILVEDIPKLPNCKTDYVTLSNHILEIKKCTENNNTDTPLTSDRLIHIFEKYTNGKKISQPDEMIEITNLGINSLNFIIALTEIEKEYGIEIDFDDEEVAEKFTIQGLREILKRNTTNEQG